jgi:CDP-glucose 4,6-dehydratase
MELPLGQRLRELSGPLLLTGHTGFKGTWMTLLLEHLSVPVIGYSLASEKDSLFDRAQRIGSIPEKFADIRNYEELEGFIDLHKPSTIIHMAAQPLVLKSYENPRETFDINVMGTVNVLDIAFRKDFIKAIVIVTTDKVYKNHDLGDHFLENDPLQGKDPYSSSKVGAEAAAAAWQHLNKVNKLRTSPNVLAVRAGNVIGGGDFSEYRLAPDLIRGYLTKQSIELRHPESTRPWQHVLDPLTGYLKALELLVDSVLPDALNFGPVDSSLSVLEMTEIAKKVLEISVYCTRHEHEKAYEAKTLSLDSSLAGSTVNWSSTWNQEVSIYKTFEWWKKVLDSSISAEMACKSDIDSYLRDLRT